MREIDRCVSLDQVLIAEVAENTIADPGEGIGPRKPAEELAVFLLFFGQLFDDLRRRLSDLREVSACSGRC